MYWHTIITANNEKTYFPLFAGETPETLWNLVAEGILRENKSLTPRWRWSVKSTLTSGKVTKRNCYYDKDGKILMGEQGWRSVRALASHQCGPGSSLYIS